MAWKPLAIQLGMSHAKIGEIDVNNRGQVAECRYDMIQFWLQSDVSCSWQKLIGALKSSNHLTLAEKIKSIYCPMVQGQLVKQLHVCVVFVRVVCACFPGALCEPQCITYKINLHQAFSLML